MVWKRGIRKFCRNPLPLQSHMSTHAYSQEEVYGFTQYINNNLKTDKKVQQYLPIDPNGDQVFRVISESDGVLLAELVLFAAGGDARSKKRAEAQLATFAWPRPGKRLNVFEVNNNFNLIIQAASAIGIKVVNIGATDLKTGKPYLVLGMLWQVIRMALSNKLSQTSHGSKDTRFEQAGQNEFEALI